MQTSDIGSDSTSRKRPRVNLLVLLFATAAIAWILSVITRPEAARQRVRPVGPAADVASDAEVVGNADVDDSGSEQRRLDMVDLLQKQGITDPSVLRAMRRVPRHEFVPDDQRGAAYMNKALPLDHGQTISQPYIVAIMTQLVNAHPGAHALDIGTGSGYQAAILAELVEEVHSVEIICELADSARRRLKRQGYVNVNVTCGDGYQGLPDEAPFDVIVVAAAAGHVPEPLIEQLAPGGRLIIPVGDNIQQLQLITKSQDGMITKKNIEYVRFVPMTGKAQGDRD
jgi:protein-L-isoaspartate(D-aspartate) O-methyltransferase